MKRLSDSEIVGKKYNRWTVIRVTRKVKYDPKVWCRCECGTEKECDFWSIRYGDSKSCGCYNREPQSKSLYDHGQWRTRLYGIWAGMMTRCYNTKDRTYANYGEKGIRVCERWHDFTCFRDDMKAAHDAHVASHGENETSIDRIDNDGDYTLDNCRWATRREQGRNRRTSIRIEFKGETRFLAEWAEIMGLPPHVVWNRLDNGYTVSEALLKPNDAYFRVERYRAAVDIIGCLILLPMD